MAIDSKEKRQAIFGIARPWQRNTFPVATPNEQWRMSVGNVYGGNALSPFVGVIFAPYYYLKLLTGG